MDRDRVLTRKYTSDDWEIVESGAKAWIGRVVLEGVPDSRYPGTVVLYPCLYYFTQWDIAQPKDDDGRPTGPPTYKFRRVAIPDEFFPSLACGERPEKIEEGVVCGRVIHWTSRLSFKGLSEAERARLEKCVAGAHEEIVQGLREQDSPIVRAKSLAETAKYGEGSLAMDRKDRRH
jgi:hypothetical protein